MSDRKGNREEAARGELGGEVVAVCGGVGVSASVKQDEEDGDDEHSEARGGLVRRQRLTRLGFCPTRIMVVRDHASVR
ncbi:hypothetical protein L1987_71284 [Smallanthus sonchifolius]|uniref:Uncharacterized protein n=1 Tax=Smallanthus sonchifolius TaxID=185202 RepID=A0ACB9ASU3_9ASTR|nr:hypothetical protein L1987_71284 [Smallanthus sonchifolius]